VHISLAEASDSRSLHLRLSMRHGLM